MAAAAGEQQQGARLRCPGLQRVAARGAQQVGGQRRTGAHGEYAGLRARRIDHRRDITGGEHFGVRQRLQRRAGRDETAGVECQPAVAQPAWCGGAGGPHREMTRNAASVSQPHGVGLDTGHARLGHHVDLLARQFGHHTPLQPRRQPVEDMRRAVDQGTAHQRLPVMQRHDDFDAGGPGADDCGSARGARGMPAFEQLTDRLHRMRAAVGTRQIGDARRRTGVDRQHVVVDQLAAGQPDLPLPGVQRHRGIQPERAAGPRCQRGEIDAGLPVVVMAGDDARHHAGVGRQRIGRDQADHRVGLFAREGFQHE